MAYREGYGIESQSSILSNQNPTIPLRLHRLSALPWYDCWVQQLRVEKKVSTRLELTHYLPERSALLAFQGRKNILGKKSPRFR